MIQVTARDLVQKQNKRFQAGKDREEYGSPVFAGAKEAFRRKPYYMVREVEHGRIQQKPRF